MNQLAALNEYKSVGVKTGVDGASPHQLIGMLLQGALDRIASARGAMERGNVALRGENIGAAIAIIDSLRVSLDLEQGGQIAENLESLYFYLEQRLLSASTENDIDALHESSNLLRQVHEAWQTIPDKIQVQ